MLLYLLVIVAICAAIGWFNGHPWAGTGIGVVLALIVLFATPLHRL